MTPDGLITSEFDDAAIVDEEFDDFDEFDEFDEQDADLELVVLELSTVVGGDLDDVAAPQVQAVAGAEDLIRSLREVGVAVALGTASPRPAVDAALDALGWHRLADLTLTAAEAGRGVPYPDLPLTALLRAGATSVDGMVVVADTPGGIASGIAAGAGLVVGVPTGADDEDALLSAGADAVIPSIVDLAALLGLDDDDAR